MELGRAVVQGHVARVDGLVAGALELLGEPDAGRDAVELAAVALVMVIILNIVFW